MGLASFLLQYILANFLSLLFFFLNAIFLDIFFCILSPFLHSCFFIPFRINHFQLPFTAFKIWLYSHPTVVFFSIKIYMLPWTVLQKSLYRGQPSHSFNISWTPCCTENAFPYIFILMLWNVFQLNLCTIINIHNCTLTMHICSFDTSKAMYWS